VKFFLDTAKLLRLPAGASVLLYLAAAVLAGVGLVLGELRGWGEQHRKALDEAHRLLSVSPERSGRLPLLREVSAYRGGVTRSRYADRTDPHVAQAVDGRLEQVLRACLEREPGAKPLVLVKGVSKAGKPRTALEVARRVLGEASLVVPAVVPGGMQKLFSSESPLRWGGGPVLVWLDDLDRFLQPEGLEAGTEPAWASDAPKVVSLVSSPRSLQRKGCGDG